MKSLFIVVFFIVTLFKFIDSTFGDEGLAKDDMNEFSPYIYGVLSRNGEVIKNQEIKFGMISADVNQEITTVTNDDGEFEFESVLRPKKKSIFSELNEVRVTVYIIANIEGEEIVIWNGVFSKYKVHPFARNNMGNLNCDITNPLRYFGFEIENSSVLKYVYSQCSLFGYKESEIHGN